MADVTIKIDADTARYIAKLSQMAEQTKGVGHHTRSIGDQWKHANEHMGKALLRGTAIAEVIAKAAEEMNRFAQKSSELSKKSGGDALSRSTALGKLGLGGNEGFDNYVQNVQGAASASERTQGLEALASFQEETRFTLDRKTVTRYVRLISSGLYKPEELLRLIKRGLPLPTDEEVAQKLQGLSPEAKQELAIRAKEYQNEQRQADALRAPGARNRLFASEREAAEAEHPFGYGVVNAIEGVPIVGEVAKAGEREIGKALSPDKYDPQTLDALNGIRANTKPSKQLNLTGQGE